MKRLEPVIWAKGTFLTLQHLRLQLAIPEYRERGLDVSAPVSQC